MKQDKKDLILLAAELCKLKVEWDQDKDCFIQVNWKPHYAHWDPLTDASHFVEVLDSLTSTGVILNIGLKAVECVTRIPNTITRLESDWPSNKFNVSASIRLAVVLAASKVALALRGNQS